jgi:hypothetical protein
MGSVFPPPNALETDADRFPGEPNWVRCPTAGTERVRPFYAARDGFSSLRMSRSVGPVLAGMRPS